MDITILICLVLVVSAVPYREAGKLPISLRLCVI